MISGTPRTNSMKITHSRWMIGSLERRPSASTIPIGSDSTMPTSAITRVSMKPPHLSVVTDSSPSPPRSSQNEAIGKTRKKK